MLNEAFNFVLIDSRYTNLFYLYKINESDRREKFIS
jgi:hypothetical protein